MSRIIEVPEIVSPENRKILLDVARKAVEAAVTGVKRPEPPTGSEFEPCVGVFVTIKKEGELRGCIGRLSSDAPLGETVVSVARDSALSDPRFPAVRETELGSLEYEISVMTPMVPIDVSEIEVGRHGVQMELHGRRAVFLPQVAPEWGWDREEMLDQLSLKAGLPPGSWRDPRAKFTAFEAEVFGE